MRKHRLPVHAQRLAYFRMGHNITDDTFFIVDAPRQQGKMMSYSAGVLGRDIPISAGLESCQPWNLASRLSF